MKQREKVITLGVALGILVVAVVVILIARSGGGGDEAPKAVVKHVKLPKPTKVVGKGEPAKVTMKTSEGTFVITLDTERAPKTANSFAYLTEKGFYDGLGFHRIVPDFVIQGGDPTGTGSGGPGYKVVEPPPKNLKYTRGIVAMAKTAAEAPGTSGSQFYVVTGDDAGLPPEYALVGKVTSGMDVVEKIGTYGKPNDQTGTPTKSVVIEKATLEKG